VHGDHSRERVMQGCRALMTEIQDNLNMKKIIAYFKGQ